MYLFLDIDGVLNQLQPWHIDTSCVECLKILVNKLSTKIVLTSSWRLGFTHNINYCSPQIQKLIKVFNDFSIEIYSKTPSVNENNRSLEIYNFLESHKNDDYLILDDDKTLFSNSENLYIVNYRTGLIKKDVKKILKLYS